MEYRRMDLFSTIKMIAENNAGIITTAAVESAGISRMTLKNYVDSGKLVRESKGIYSLADDFSDEYRILQSRSLKLIYSYGTALYLWGMSDKTPNVLEVSVPSGYNVSRIKKDNPTVIFHYVTKDKWDIGITECSTPMGNSVKVYNKERCICDLLSNKNMVDKQLYIQAIREYFASDIDVMRLIDCARIFMVEDKVRDYLEIMRG